MNTSQHNKYTRAKAQVEELKGFYSHFIIYCVFVPIFILINYNTTSFPWAIFPIAGWGIGILGHAANVYRWNPFFGKDWEQRKIEELVKNDNF